MAFARPGKTRKYLIPVVLVILALSVVAFAGAGSLAADSLGDKIDEARIKARAGNVNEALAELDELAEEHPDDARVHYYRSRFLRDLERRNEAADALEAAAAALEKYEASGGKDSDILGLKDAIKSDGKDLLEYRRQVREVLAEYRVKAVPLIRKLLKEGRAREASYVLDEVSAAMGEEDAELQELRKQIETAIREGENDK